MPIRHALKGHHGAAQGNGGTTEPTRSRYSVCSMWGPEGGRPYGQTRGRGGVGTIARDTVTATVGRDGVFTGATEAVLHLHRAANAVRQHVEQEVLRPKQLTWTGFVVLRTVWGARRMETRHVAEHAGISKATLTGVVDTLSGRGLVRRNTHPEDGRL